LHSPLSHGEMLELRHFVNFAVGAVEVSPSDRSRAPAAPGVPLAFDADAHGGVDAQDVEDTQYVRRWATKDDAPVHPLRECNDGL
jgi:hypothetical protein